MKKLISTPSTLSLLFTTLVIFSSCEKEDSFHGTYSNGVFISNEGNWGHSDASVSFYSYDTDSVYNGIFRKENNRPLGDVLQSITVYNDFVYLVVNASNKVEVVTRNEFQEKGTITEVSGPRYMVAKGNKGYISCWGDNTVKVVDLASLTVSNSIATGTGPEKMLIKNALLFVANSGSYSLDSTITVIDLNSETVIKTIRVSYNPKDIEVDQNGDLWALCYGKEVYNDSWELINSSASELVKINPDDYSVLQTITVSATQHASILDISPDGSKLYFGGGFSFGLIYTIRVADPTAVPELLSDDYSYGFNVHPENGEVFVTLAPSFTNAGLLKRYNAEGTLQGTYETEIGPNGAAFMKSFRNKK